MAKNFITTVLADISSLPIFPIFLTFSFIHVASNTLADSVNDAIPSSISITIQIPQKFPKDQPLVRLSHRPPPAFSNLAISFTRDVNVGWFEGGSSVYCRSVSTFMLLHPDEQIYRVEGYVNLGWSKERVRKLKTEIHTTSDNRFVPKDSSVLFYAVLSLAGCLWMPWC